ncbi:ABC transporter ATP-binding protein [Spongiactinospora sp. TRM90649]|uniref:ABC transporter ATP-binding protein n=1 Tax=Spongiactinospora sp. TRM90649 TaxID=3031114 RepID=UPI0023F979AD|nr:ABC transporter ATP-binding protein [Spongiactinospora sp. TRM90649]MDF5758079.1 ABC transporter ATP-binding protein [Spongiactinospora sp. TRM90649]
MSASALAGTAGRGAGAPATPLLEASRIIKRFAGVTALNGAGLTLAAGEVLGLIGPNGSGKTTLVNCVSGVLPIDGGEIRLKGRAVTRASRVERARLGIARTFQNLKLFGELTVRDNVMVGRNASRTRGSDRDAVEALLADLHLTDLAREVVSALPYGHQRRVEIARALAGDPDVLLLDEPAAGLNDGETAELRGLLHRVRRERGCGIVLIDHDMNLVLGVSNRVQVLDEGRIIYEGAPQDAFKQPEVVDAYLGSA